jgi:hypothetical protein
MNEQRWMGKSGAGWRGASFAVAGWRTGDGLDLPTHLEAVSFRLDDVGTSHKEKRLGSLELLEKRRLLRIEKE